MEKISAVYKIVNKVTGDSYVGSSNDVIRRWAQHKYPSVWKAQPNNPLYMGMQKYGLNAFRFQILAPVVPEHLKEVEQELIEMLHPTYNQCNANGLNIEKRRKSNNKYQKKYDKTDKGKETYKKYRQSDKGKETHRKASHKYQSQLCSFNGEIIKLCTLSTRFQRAGIEHPTLEAKKYLLPSK